MENWGSFKDLMQMKTPEDMGIFEKKIGEFAASQDPDILLNLIDLFENDCPSKDSMFGLIHAIESYPDEIYTKAILSKINTGLKKYFEWIVRLVNRILNDDKCKTIFFNNIHLAAKSDLIDLFQAIEKKYPQHKDLIAELTIKLKDS